MIPGASPTIGFRLPLPCRPLPTTTLDAASTLTVQERTISAEKDTGARCRFPDS